jgi:hypothetical protein
MIAVRERKHSLFLQDSVARLAKDQSIEELLPWLYLKGSSTGDFNEALEAQVRPDSPRPMAHCKRAKRVW